MIDEGCGWCTGFVAPWGTKGLLHQPQRGDVVKLGASAPRSQTRWTGCPSPKGRYHSDGVAVPDVAPPGLARSGVGVVHLGASAPLTMDGRPSRSQDDVPVSL